MSLSPDVAIIVCTYQRPRNLRACLGSIANQRGVDGRFEVVVADDGSGDETPLIAEEFRRSSSFPVRFSTHPHDGFQPGRCRNEGVRASGAPYILFVDGDCALPPDHVRIHLEERRDGAVCASDCLRLDAAASERFVASLPAAFRSAAPYRERWRVLRDHFHAEMNWLYRMPHHPKLFANNIGIWRGDFERVNGFDEKFRDWGCEDDDLRLRLLQANLVIRSIRHRAPTIHLWHAPDPTVPARWAEGSNVPYLQRKYRLTRCVDGLEKRTAGDLSVRVRNAAEHEKEVALLPFASSAGESERADLEVLFLPGPETFTGNADCNVLVLTEPVRELPLNRTHLLFTDLAGVRFDGPMLHLDELRRVMDVIR